MKERQSSLNKLKKHPEVYPIFDVVSTSFFYHSFGDFYPTSACEVMKSSLWNSFSPDEAHTFGFERVQDGKTPLFIFWGITLKYLKTLKGIFSYIDRK